MESDSLHDRALARTALDSIDEDRRALSARVTSQTWWSAPAQGLAAGLLVVAPAAGIALPMAFVMALSSLAFIGIDYLARRRLRLTFRTSLGATTLTILVLLVVFLVLMVGLSIYCEIVGARTAVVLIAVGTAVVCGLASAAYDYAYARELRHAR